MATVAVYLEKGQKRVFACALAWPGWCRSGKSEELALEALAACADRYAPVAREAGERLPTAVEFDVVERVAGTSTTDFGAPDAQVAADREPLAPPEAQRLARLVAASWTVFDAVVARAPAELRKGPRGGGRDRDRLVEHVLGAEVAYARKLGLRNLRQPGVADRTAIEAHRQAVLTALRAAAPPEDPNGWPVPYAARRIAWHVVDHTWEVEDRSA